MSPRPDVSEERRDQILDAASEVFAEKGVHETRMDDIVKQSGLSKGTLYWYFKSKDEIVLNIFERIFSREFKSVNCSCSHFNGADAFIDVTKREIYST